jgi:hypothetical protein
MPDSSDTSTDDGRDRDVTITITGTTAAEMLTRGEATARELTALVRTLGEKLEAAEAATRQQADERARLAGLVQTLGDRLSLMGGQVAGEITELRGELGRLRAEGADLGGLRQEITGQGEKLPRLQRRLEDLAIAVAEITRRLDERQAAAEHPDTTQAGDGNPPAVGRESGVGGFFTATAGRFKRLNFLWSLAGAGVLAGAGAAVWMLA